MLDDTFTFYHDSDQAIETLGAVSCHGDYPEEAQTRLTYSFNKEMEEITLTIDIAESYGNNLSSSFAEYSDSTTLKLRELSASRILFAKTDEEGNYTETLIFTLVN